MACVRVLAQKYHSDYDDEIVKKIIDEGSTRKPWASKNEGFWQRWWISSARPQDINDEDLKRDVTQFCDSLTDQEFLSNIDTYLKDEPLVEPAIRQAVDSIYDSLSSTLKRLFGELQPWLMKKRRDAVMVQVREQINAYQRDNRKSSAERFIQEINSVQIAEDDQCVNANLIDSQLTRARISSSPTVVLKHFQVIAQPYRGRFRDISRSICLSCCEYQVPLSTLWPNDNYESPLCWSTESIDSKFRLKSATISNSIHCSYPLLQSISPDPFLLRFHPIIKYCKSR